MFRAWVLLFLVLFLHSEECLGRKREWQREDSAMEDGNVRSAVPQAVRNDKSRKGQDLSLTSISTQTKTPSTLRQVARPDRWDSLGFGVEPFDSLFEHRKLRGRVLDLGPFPSSSQVPQRANMIRVGTVHTEKRTVQGFDKFIRKLKADLRVTVSIKSFRAGLSRHFYAQAIRSRENFFSRTASVVERAHIRVTEPTIEHLRNLVIPSVARFLAIRNPQQIFSIYGTHVTTGLVVGGELELWSSSRTSSFSSDVEFSRAVSASFKKFVTGSSSLSVEESSLLNKIETLEGLLVRGGDLRSGPNGENDWIASTAENAKEIAYLPNGVVPIWYLIRYEKQANRVREEYERIYDAKEIILKRFSSPSLDKVPRYAHPIAQIYVPNGWKVVSGGATVQFFGPGQLLTKSFPIVEKRRAVGWQVQSKDHYRRDHGRIQAHAIAIWDPFDSYDVVVRMATSGVASRPAINVTLPSGYTRVGGGASTLFVPPGNMLVASYPTRKRTWSVSSKDHIGRAPCRIEAYVIGVRFRDGGAPHARVKSLTFGPFQDPFGSVYATHGYGITGGGAKASTGGAGTMLVNLVPRADGQSFFANAKHHLHADRQRLTVYAIEVQDAIFVETVAEAQSLRGGPIS